MELTDFPLDVCSGKVKTERQSKMQATAWWQRGIIVEKMVGHGLHLRPCKTAGGHLALKTIAYPDRDGRCL
jgi:hypothetical protein